MSGHIALRRAGASQLHAHASPSAQCRPQQQRPPTTWSTAHQRRTEVKLLSASADAVAATETLTGEGLERWQLAVEAVTILGLEESEADKLLSKAFGWSNTRYWKQAKVRAVPEVQEVEGALEYLRGLGLTDAELAGMVKAFPELLACAAGGLLQENVGKLQKEWRMQGPTLARTLARRPEVLGYAFDCEGSCFGECDRCWARF